MMNRTLRRNDLETGGEQEGRKVMEAKGGFKLKKGRVVTGVKRYRTRATRREKYKANIEFAKEGSDNFL